MNLSEAVNQVGGVDVVAEALGVQPNRLSVAMSGARPMSAQMAKAWNKKWGNLHPVTVPEDKRKSKKITLHVQSDVWAVAKKLAQKFETTPIRAANELMRLGSYGNFAATLAWLHAAKIVGDEVVPREWRFFQSESQCDIDPRPVSFASVLEDF